MDDGAVLFCTRTEMYFGINHVGATIWEALPDPGGSDRRGFDEVLAVLHEAYPDVDAETLRADMAEFLAAMRQSELVIDAPPPEA